MRQQVMDRDPPLRRHEAVFRRLPRRRERRAHILVRRLLEHGDLHVGELGQVLRDLVRRSKTPLLDHHHRRHSEHGFDEDAIRKIESFSIGRARATSIKPYASKWTTLAAPATAVTAP